MKRESPTALKIELLAYSVTHPDEPPMGLKRLAFLSKFTETKVSHLIEGKREITPRDAQKLSEILDVDCYSLMSPWVWSDVECPDCCSRTVAEHDNRRMCAQCGKELEMIA